jgi:hypothetical protein
MLERYFQLQILLEKHMPNKLWGQFVQSDDHKINSALKCFLLLYRQGSALALSQRL